MLAWIRDRAAVTGIDVLSKNSATLGEHAGEGPRTAHFDQLAASGGSSGSFRTRRAAALADALARLIDGAPQQRRIQRLGRGFHGLNQRDAARAA
jgi:hypothetical protein